MSERALSEKSPATIGLTIGITVFFITVLGAAGTFGVGMWQCGKWVGEINKSLDSIMLDIKIVKADQTDLKLKWDDHERRISKIETVGSPQLQKIMDQLSGLQRTMDLHTAKEKGSRNEP